MKLSFFGDISLANINAQNLTFCDRLNQLLSESDINIANLECPITTKKKKDDLLAVTMSAPDVSLDLLKDFDLFSLANNHIKDYLNAGLEDTIRAIETRNKLYFGIGKSQSEALEPCYIEKEGFKFAFIGATRWTNSRGADWGTGNDGNPIILSRIEKLKKKGYFVILFFHWGYEYVRIPSARERKIAHRCIDRGADIVIGSHPHIYQTIETYKGKTIVYSLGNFIFHSSIFDRLSYIPNDPRLNESYVVSIDIAKDHNYSIEINGYRTNDRKVVLYSQEDNVRLKKELDQISQVHYGSKWEYLKKYYNQTYEISQQSIKVRKKYLNYNNLSMWEKIKSFKNPNMQDLKNRIGGIIISYFMKQHDKTF